MKKNRLVLLTVAFVTIVLFCSVVTCNAETVASGECGAEGDNATWSLDDTGTVVINGNGAMVDNNLYGSPFNEGFYRVWEGNDYKEIPIKKVVIENGITNIGDNTFFGCSNLISVSIPGSVERFGSRSFHGCSSLKSIQIPESATAIGYGAFSGCSSLTDVTLPSGLSIIESGTFSGCSSITTISIPANVSSIESDAFYSCEGMTRISIPDSVTYIGEQAFSGCKNLNSISLPSSLEYIMNRSFANCSSLTTINIPSKVKYVVGDTFNGCSSLMSIYVDSYNKNYFSLEGVLYNGPQDYDATVNLVRCPEGKKGRFGIPQDVNNICHYAFYGCNELVDISIPNSVTTIGDNAFSHCGGLTSISIPDSVTEIGEYVFSHCTKLTKISIPNNVTYIPYAAFMGCINIASIYIADSVTSIGNYAFANCTGLKNITIPNSVISILSDAFSGCSSLESITLPDKLNTIEKSFFSGCSKLKSVTMPKSIKYIKAGAFLDCYSLTDVNYCGSEDEWNSITIKGGNDELTKATIHYNYNGGDNGFTINGKRYTLNLDYYANNLNSSTFDNELCSLLAAINCCVGSEEDNRNANKTLGFVDNKFNYYDDQSWFRSSITFSIDKKTKNGKTIYLINLMGTHNIWDILNDIEVVGTGYDHPVHKGFYVAADRVMKKLKTDYFNGEDPEYDNNTKYFIVGHSLGAATGNLFAAELGKYVGKDSIYNYNFACPNTVAAQESLVDNPDVYNTMSAYSNIFNICRVSDEVPYLPGLESTVLLEAKELKQYGWDLFECFHKKHDYYWGKWGVTKWFDDGITGVFPAHDLPNYFKYVSKSNPMYITAPTYDDYFVKGFYTTFIFCPVDAKVVDTDGKVLAAVINDEPVYYNESFGKVIVATTGDMKSISYSANANYKIEMTATDSGKMDCVIAQGGINADEYSDVKIFHDIALTKGKEMISVVDNETFENSGLNVLDSQGQTIAKIAEDGTEEPVGDSCEHAWDTEYTVDTPPTCTSEGKESIYCTKCGVIKANSTRLIPKKTHTYGSWRTAVAATEIATGKQSRTCSICGDTQTQVISQLAPTLPPVKISKPKSAKKSATIKWKKPSKKNLKKIKKIEIQYSTDSSFSSGVKSKYAGAKKTSVKIKGLAKGQKYFVRIRAINGGHVSAWSAVKSVKAK